VSGFTDRQTGNRQISVVRVRLASDAANVSVSLSSSGMVVLLERSPEHENKH